jgi:hypothetical protein
MTTRRDDSIALYSKPCPVDMKPHDWRYASHAPGYEIGDICASCQKCHLRAISPNSPARGGA